MKRITLLVLTAAVCVAFTGCKKKEPTLGERLDSGVKKMEKAANQTAKDADKAANDAQKKLDKELNK